MKKFDFSMCANNGCPMMLDDIGKFYRENHLRDKTTPVINVFKVDYVDGRDNLMLPRGIDMLCETNNKTRNRYMIAHYYLARNFEAENDDERDVINILYWKETEHYYLITNLKALILNVNFNNSIKVETTQKLCYVCLNLVDVRYTEMRVHVNLCRSRNEKQHISYPIEGKTLKPLPTLD